MSRYLWNSLYTSHQASQPIAGMLNRGIRDKLNAKMLPLAKRLKHQIT